jgi:hypothetical protein
MPDSSFSALDPSDRIFSLLSEPSPNAAGAQGLGGFSAQGASRRVIVLTGVLLGPADEVIE